MFIAAIDLILFMKLSRCLNHLQLENILPESYVLDDLRFFFLCELNDWWYRVDVVKLFIFLFRRQALQRKAEEAQISTEEQQEMLRNLERKETEYMRMQRRKMGIDDFEQLTVIGRGSFGEVRCLLHDKCHLHIDECKCFCLFTFLNNFNALWNVAIMKAKVTSRHLRTLSDGCFGTTLVVILYEDYSNVFWRTF